MPVGKRHHAAAAKNKRFKIHIGTIAFIFSETSVSEKLPYKNISF